MFINQSPWLHQLKRTRPVAGLEGSSKTGVAIVGGGIAGVTTAYFTLKNTKQRVMLLEAGKIAHGATGHNGGFLATYFERSFKSLIQEFGLEMATQGQRDIDSAWDLLESIRSEARLQTPVWSFIGYAAMATYEELMVHVRNSALRKKAGLPVPDIFVSDSWSERDNIPALYKGFYKLLPKQEILSLIETRDEEYCAVLAERKGCMNSALFCEELVGYLLAEYPDRFALAEQAPVQRAVLGEASAVLHMQGGQTVHADAVVLCTNGFENIEIVNKAGDNINKKFHHMVRGIVGYMAGYTEESSKPPEEISFLPKTTVPKGDVYTEDPYFYLTRRPYEARGYQNNLISIGGPEALMDDTNNYKVEHPFPTEARNQIDNFLRYTYRHDHTGNIEYKFLWHGLMGFTPNGVRLIGPEPLNPLLLYNLGCNGVGLMPSIFGGSKIARFLAGEALPPSMFDPKDLRASGKARVVQPRSLKHVHKRGVSIKRAI